MPHASAFVEIALTLMTAAVVGGIAIWLRQPLIVSFIAVGILVGPAGMSLITHHDQVELLASLGISLLLFVVGLRLDVQAIRTLGPVATIAGTGQILVTVLAGLGLSFALGLDAATAGYVAVALAFSSTIIVVKMLSDRREINALHGRIAVGLLIVQDVAVILVMIGLTAVGGATSTDRPLWLEAVTVLVKGLGFLAVVAAFAVWGLPAVAARFARSPELLVLSGIGWAVALAALADGLGLSKEIGAFVAGTALASTPYRDAIGSRLVTVRDFLLLFFFIELGSRLDLSLLGATFGQALVLSAFVLVGKPVIVMAILGAMGYRKRTGFMAGVTLAQISEFSLILAALGLSLGHLTPAGMGLITTTGLITIGVSTYLINYSGPLYQRLAGPISFFEKRMPFREGSIAHSTGHTADVVVFGLGRYGGGIVRHLLLRGRRVVGVDFDPQVLTSWRAEGVPVLYGDAADPELFEHLPLDDVAWVVTTAAEIETSRILLRHLQERRFAGKVAVACRTADEGDTLRLEGADLLLRPYADAAEQAADSLTTAMERLPSLAGATPGLREVRLGMTSAWAGSRIHDLPLRNEFGTTVLAISRGGRSLFNPGPDVQLFPGDRLVLSGEPEGLDRAVAYLGRVEQATRATDDDFAVEEIAVQTMSAWCDRTLADLALPGRYGVTVLAVSRDGGRLQAPDPRRPLHIDDRLVLAGPPDALSRARAEGAR